MKDTNSLVRRRFSRLISFAIYSCIVLLAVAPFAVNSARARKHDADLTKAVAVNRAGAAKAAAPAPRQMGGPEVIGQWGPVEQLDTVPVHVSLLPDGRLLYWGRDKAPDNWDIGGSCQTYTWHPTTKARVALASKPSANLFCSGHSFLPDGRLLVAGGHVRNDAVPSREGIGETAVHTFDYRTNLWARVLPGMQQGRWYPSNVTLANGETVIMSGYINGVSARNDIPDLFTSANTIRRFTASSPIPVYPFLHLAPNGKVFFAGPGPGQSQFFDTAANGGGGAFSNVSTMNGDHIVGSSVVYDGGAGKVLMMGGAQFTGGTALSTSEKMNLSGPGLFWELAAFLNYPRKHHTSVVLPDGKVLVAGGTGCSGGNDISCGAAARNPEIWDPNLGNPSTGTWSVMAANPSGIPRVYHSVALLLPDARVLVGGGGLPAAGGEVVPNLPPSTGTTNCFDGSHASSNVNCRTFGHKDVEIFSPPYLFTTGGALATRPRIITSPSTVSRGQTFAVGKNSGIAGLVGSVVFIRLPSVTHGFSFDQRRVVANFQVVSSTSINVTVPADGRVLPPGHYMMFLVNTSGVPSVAKIMQVT